MTEIDHEGGALLTRRHLVQAGSVAAASLYLGALTTGAAAAVAPAATAPAYLRRSSYAGLQDTAFTATGAGGAKIVLRLAEVADLARARTEKALAGRDDAFALALTGPRAGTLAGAVHELRHATLGAFSLFVVPVGRATSAGQRYEVVVDRSMTLARAQAVAPH